MVTATDDQSDRLTVLETGFSELRAEVRALNARLASLETGVSELRAEIQAEIRALNARLTAVETGVSDIRADIRALNDRLDRFQVENTRFQSENAARIERVFWAVVGAGVAVVVVGGGIIGTLIAALFSSG